MVVRKIIGKRSISSNVSLLDALRQMDEEKVKMLFVFENNHFVSILTIGDIQRAIVKNVALDSPIVKIVKRDKKFAYVGEQMDSIRKKMLGLMTVLSEKPELTYQVNTGVYILNPTCIDEIPEGEFFHITHLMEKIKFRGGRVGCFPVSEHAWKDMGEWSEYLKMIDVL